MWFDNLRYLDTGRRRQSEIGVNLYRTLTNLARDCDHDGVDVDEQLEMILETSGMRGADDDADEGNVSEDNAVEENLAELLKAAHGFSDRGEFLVYVDKFKGRKETLEGNPVRLLTIHKAKGLEFDTVFLIGADDKVLPHRLSENVEEERRLAYVAVSRAKDNLFVLSQGVPSKFFNMFWRLTPKEKNEEEVGV
jgi:superfamily I DNA/RNA helicase